MAGLTLKPQYSLRALLICVCLASVLFALVSCAGVLGAFAYFFLLAIVLIATGLWKKRGALVITGVLILGVEVASLHLASVAKWIGRGTFLVRVEVVDSNSGEPIPGATVRVFDQDGRNSSGITDEAGRTGIRAVFTTVGSRGAFEDTGVIYLFQKNIKIECDGYQTLDRELAAFTGDSCDLYTPIPSVTVELKRGD